MFKKSAKPSAKPSNYGNETSGKYQKTNANGTHATSAQDNCHVLKSGYAKKLKTMKQKFFVLLSATENQDAQLQYYDSAKKWSNNVQPKRVIILKDCFIINQHMDAKQRHALSLYTTDDCFSIVFDKESEMEDWLQLMVELQKSNNPENARPFPAFEYIWEVTIKNRGLGMEKKIAGQYRLCLSAQALNLIKMGIVNPPDMEFPLLSVRRCGHSDALFFMELGRSACIGAGELWMQTGDTITAQNMHETILSAMKSSRSVDENISSNKPRSRRSTNSFSYNSDTLPSVRYGYSYGSNRMDNLDSSAHGTFRQRTVSEGQHSLSKEWSKKLNHKKESDRPQSIGLKALSFSDDFFPRNSGVAVSPLSDAPLYDDNKSDHLMSLHSMTSLHKPEPTISEEGESVEDYLSMDPSNQPPSDEYLDMDPTEIGSSEAAKMDSDVPSKPTTLVQENESTDSPKPASIDPYVEMNSPACSPVQSTLNSGENYLFMSSGVGIKCPSPCSSLNSSMVSNDEYMDMSGKSLSDQHHSGYHLDKVHSYISDFSDGDDFPMRSYSVGAAAKSNFLFDQKHRTRAFSCGSHDDAAKMKLKGQKSKAVSRISSEELDQKSISAPHLPGQKSQTYGGSRQEDLMELEFMPESISSTCSQSSSVSSISGRSRSGSKSSSSRFKMSGSKYRSGDDNIESTSPIDRVTIESSKMELVEHGFKIISGSGGGASHIADKMAAKMSPSQELVQHLFTTERQSKMAETKPPIQEEVSTTDINDEAGDYINIDFEYQKQDNQIGCVVNLPNPVASGNVQSSSAKTHDYANVDFSCKLPATPTQDKLDFKEPTESKETIATMAPSATNYTIKKQQSAPAMLPTKTMKSPIRKSSCPVTSTQPKFELDKHADRKYSLEPPLTYENISFPHPHKSPFNSRPSSVCSELELNYASLDLAPACEEDERGRGSPRSMTSQNSSTNNISLDEGESSASLSYAKIDFTRSEGLRATTNSLVENKH